MSRNQAANIQFNLPQMTYQSAQLSVPNPVNTVAPANTQMQQVLLQALDSLGTGIYRAGRVIGQSKAAEKAAAAQIGEAEASEWGPRFKDGMLDNPKDIAEGRTPVQDWFDSLYATSQETGVPLEDVVRRGMADWAASNVDPDMNEREAAAYQAAFVADVAPAAIAYARGRYIKPQYEALRDNVIAGLATLDLADFGIDRGRQLGPAAAQQLELLAGQGITDADDSKDAVLLDAARMAVSEGNYGRAQQLLGAAGSVTGDLLDSKAAIEADLGKALRGEATEGLAQLLAKTSDGADRFSTIRVQVPGELMQLVTAADELGGDESFGRDLEAALISWNDESPLPPHARRMLLRGLMNTERPNGEPLFALGSRQRTRINGVIRGIDDQEESYETQRRLMDNQAEDLIFEYIVEGTLNGEKSSDAQFLAFMKERFGTSGPRYYERMRRERARGDQETPSTRKKRVALDKAIQSVSSDTERAAVGDNIRAAYENNEISLSDYNSLRTALKETAKFDRIKTSPRVQELRDRIEASFRHQVLGERLYDPGAQYDDRPAPMSPDASGRLELLLLDFDQEFEDFYFSKEYEDALDKRDDQELNRLERAFIRKQTLLYFQSGVEGAENRIFKAAKAAKGITD